MVTDTDGFIGLGFTRGLIVVQNPPVPLAAEQDPLTAVNRCAFCYALTIPPVYSIPQGSGRGSAKAYRSAARHSNANSSCASSGKEAKWDARDTSGG